jgi:hypothetical protein
VNAAIVVIEIVAMAVIGTISFLLFFSEDNADDLATTSSGGGVVIRSGVTLFDLFDDDFFAMLASAGSILTTPKDAALETVAISDNKQRSRFIVTDGYERLGRWCWLMFYSGLWLWLCLLWLCFGFALA